MPAIQAVLCDLDGLLIDSEPLGMQALRLLLAEHGYPFSATIAHQLIGRRPADGAQLLLDHYALPYTVPELIEHHRQRILDLVLREAQPMLGAVQLLETIQQLGLKAALATSSPRHYLDQVVARFGWQGYFQATVSGEEVQAGKPAPDIFVRAAMLLNIAPEHTIVLEDSPPGAHAGLAAGGQVWVVTHPLTEQLDFPAGINKVQSLLDVVEWLNKE